MKLKRTFTISLKPELAELIELEKKKLNKSYTEIIVDALNQYFEVTL